MVIKHKQSHLISVIIPFYNEIDLIDRAVSSVFNQYTGEYKVEVIVINDGIIDNLDILKKISHPKTEDLKVVPNAYNSGAGGARNTGIDISKGSLIAFLDSDDFWLKGKLYKQISLIESGHTFVCTNYKEVPGGYVTKQPLNLPTKFRVALNTRIGTSTLLIKRSLIGNQRFSNLKKCQDFEFWMRLSASKDYKYGVVKKNLTVYSPSGRTSDKFNQLKYVNLALTMNKFNLFQRVFIIFVIIFKALKKKSIESNLKN